MRSSMRKPGVVPAMLLSLAVLSQIVLSHAGHSAPVLIWCPNNQSDAISSTRLSGASNPLQKLSSEDFERTLFQLDKVIDLLIVADELCVEDFKNNKVLSNATSGTRLYYLPSVDTPYSAFRKTFNYKQMKTIEDINDDHELNMILKDADSSTCIALTGKECRYSHTERIKRETLTDDSTDFIIETDRVLFYSSKPLSFKATNREAVLLPSSNANASTNVDEDGTLRLILKFSAIKEINNLILEFLFPVTSINYYTMKQVEYKMEGEKETLETKQDIYFPFNFSYHCSLDTVFLNGTAYLNISNIQVQIDPKNPKMFNDAYDCICFTSIPIWTGIFVTAILALIMIWALTMIMDIRTMDRFDDPKGKTITISAAE